MSSSQVHRGEFVDVVRMKKWKRGGKKKSGLVDVLFRNLLRGPEENQDHLSEDIRCRDQAMTETGSPPLDQLPSEINKTNRGPCTNGMSIMDLRDMHCHCEYHHTIIMSSFKPCTKLTAL
jgi:hypothetical protein